MKLLHVIATPRNAQSNTLRVSEAFLSSLTKHRSDVEVEVVDLFNCDLPSMAGNNIESKYTLTMGQPIDPNHEESWRDIEQLIAHFLSADAYLLSTPMWNFGIPYALKYYIDCIVQPGYLYRYNGMGIPVPLVHNKKMICVTARGGDYSPASPMHSFDFQQPYLRSIFGFVGITDINFVTVEPTDIPPLRDAAFASAIAQAEAVAASMSGTPQPV